MSICYRNFPRGFVTVLLVIGVSMSIAQADDHAGKHNSKYGGENRGKPVQPAQVNANFQQECSACHIVYSPGLLPAASWRKVMSGLDKHFGSDASLTDQENKEITTFLVNNSSNRWSASTSPLRITDAAWFKRKHNRHEISPTVWKNPKVKSPANCTACHQQAERGNFNENNIKIPK